MRLSVLVDNLAGGTFLAEHGLSYFVETIGIKVLFDVGHSRLFLQNSEKLGINLQTDTDFIVLSHGHWDHGNGLIHMKNKKLLTHPASFTKRFRKKDSSYLGLNIDKTHATEQFQLIESEKAYKLSDTCYFLGEIPRNNSFESQHTPFKLEDGTDDFVPDDSALAIVENDELIVISGCAHSGICNIADYAIATTQCKNIRAVIGGFHLQQDNDVTVKTIEHMKKLHVKEVYPSHCTELPALSVFYGEFGIRQLKTGMVLDL